MDNAQTDPPWLPQAPFPWIEVPRGHGAMRLVCCFLRDQHAFMLWSMIIGLDRGVHGVPGMDLAQGMLLRVFTRAFRSGLIGPDVGGMHGVLGGVDTLPVGARELTFCSPFRLAPSRAPQGRREGSAWLALQRRAIVRAWG